MGITASIVSAILKAVVGDKVGSGLAKDLIGISIDGISEKGINEITDFINKEKSKIDSILSRENMQSMGISEDKTDYVVTEIKDLFSKISITDEVLRQCKYDSMNLSAFLWDKYKGLKNDYIECESEIRQCLFIDAETLINLVRESENFEKDVLIHISNVVDDTNVGLQKISEYMGNNFGKLSSDNRAILEILQMILEQNQKDSAKNKEKRQPVKSRTQEYADKWEANMFLNDFDKRDQKAGTNVKLKEVYLEEHLPHYIWGDNDENDPSTDLKELLSEYVYNHDDSKMLLVWGQPGIGKSTLITWIVANLCEKINDILVYRFASDLRNVDWKDGRISNRVLEELGLSHRDLNGKTLIIDGFDEVSIESNRRRGILDSLYIDWINNKTIKNFSLIITCRENYVSQFAILKCRYITLQPWNEIQIKSFCNIFQEKTKNSIFEVTIEKLLENKEILGIPLILYMVLALNISIEKEGSIVDIYDKIFSLEGGIYDRCIDNKNFENKHRIGAVKESIHQISREIAIWMFENEANKASIPQEEYQKICRNIIQDGKKSQEIEQDFLIGNFFKFVKHCEGIETEEIYFVHRTIYEYFVAETIYSSIERCLIELSEESQEEVAGIISIYLKQGEIIGEIGYYLKYKILKLYNRLDKIKQDIFYQWWEKLIENMMKMGMFYYAKKVSDYTNILKKETQCFVNLIEILRLLSSVNRKAYILEDTDQVLLMRYIRHSLVESKIIYVDGIEIDNIDSMCEGYLLDLSKLDFKKAYLERYDFSMIDLGETNLSYSNLTQANLLNVNFRGSDLTGADLDRADITGSFWMEDDIEKVYLQLKKAVFTHIFVEGKGEIKEVNREDLFPDNNI